MANYATKYKNKKYHKKYRNNNKRRYPSKNRRNKGGSGQMFGNFFNGNLAQNMKFGAPDSQLSGYVKREVYMKDQYGNVQRASEKQFFNSGKNIASIQINDERSKSNF